MRGGTSFKVRDIANGSAYRCRRESLGFIILRIASAGMSYRLMRTRLTKASVTWDARVPVRISVCIFLSLLGVD